MATLRIGRTYFEKAKLRGNMTRNERTKINRILREAGEKGPISTDVKKLPKSFLKSLLDEPRLSPNQRAIVAMQVHGMSGKSAGRDKIFELSVHSAVEFASVFSALGVKSANTEILLNGRWYPVTIHTDVVKYDGLGKYVYMNYVLSICEQTYHMRIEVYPELFIDEGGSPIERTVREVLAEFGLRPLEMSAAEYNLKLVRAERASREMGQHVVISGPVLVHSSQKWWSNRVESRPHGTIEMPRKGVIDHELETKDDEDHYYSRYSASRTNTSRLPFVRVFSLETKQYVFADVDDVANYDFDTEAMSRLHLPGDMLDVLTSVFNTQVQDLFGDVIQGKHGGIVVLATGNPGVGKTLTAEVYAEQTGRPLYVLELGELGTNVTQVEENLNRVFTRVARWNAVLQFDECEIFLTERGDDLDRSAIVGIFLRLLDYYQGILFLTTNRPQVLDHAVLSRVTLRLDYPDLDQDARAVIWKTMLDSAGLKLTDGSVVEVADRPMNGRQIRNLARLSKIMYPDGKVTSEQLRDVLRFGSN